MVRIESVFFTVIERVPFHIMRSSETIVRVESQVSSLQTEVRSILPKDQFLSLVRRSFTYQCKFHDFTASICQEGSTLLEYIGTLNPTFM